MKKLSVLLTPIPCAALLCLANAFKPAVIDDLAYLWYARQITVTPLEPFGPPPDGFQVLWYDRSQGAFSLLTPMVMPYWLAIGLSIFGENLILLKLWLFPFCLLFTSSLRLLLSRFARQYEKPLLAMTAFSPTFLPSLNLMVDVPTLAISLAAVTIVVRALDSPRTRWDLVVVAGLLAGLASQTKYNGTTAIALVFLYSIRRGRWRAGIVAVVVAALFFAGWEVYLSQVYGRSHFLLQVEAQRGRSSDGVGEIAKTLERKARMIVPLFGFMGGLFPTLIPFALIAFRCRARFARASIGVLACGFSLMAFVPDRWAVLWRDARNIRGEVSISTIFVGCCGILVFLSLLAICGYLGWRGWSRRKIRLRRSGDSWFLIGWLGVEVIGYFVFSPFAAVRRVMGIVVAGTLLSGRLLSMTSRAEELRRLVNLVAAFGCGLGFVVAFTDYRDALAEKNAIDGSIEWLARQPEMPRTVWFTGHWGFHYYAEKAGMRPIDPGISVLEAGDWVVYPETELRPYGQLVLLEPAWAEKIVTIEWHETWPLRTIPDYYDGFQPIRHHERYRMRIAIFRVKKRFLAQPA